MEALQETNQTKQACIQAIDMHDACTVKAIDKRPLSDATVAKICNRIAQGELLSDICKEPGVPSYTRFTREVGKNPQWKQEVTHAREAQADYFLESMVRDGNQATDKFSANAARVRAETKRWYAELVSPKYNTKRMDVTLRAVDYAQKLQATSKQAVPEKLQHKARPDKYQVEDAVEAEVLPESNVTRE